MKRLVSGLYAPAFLLGFIACGMWQPQWVVVVVFVIAVAVSFLMEQWLPGATPCTHWSTKALTPQAC